MIPMYIYEALTGDATLETQGITDGRVLELQSVDERPFDTGYFIIINWQESSSFSSLISNQSAMPKMPRVMTIWVHSPLDSGRDYRQIDKILNRIDTLLLPIEQQKGTDDIRVTCVTRQGRSGNLIDDGWKTITRNATYGVLYDEYAV